MTQSKPVRVTAKEGQVVVPSENKPEFGYIRVEQEATSFDDNGWLRKGLRSALIRGRVEDLETLEYSEGQKLQGKIIIKESTKAPYDGAEPKINPQTGEILTKDDKPIYREAFYTLNPEHQDELISHDTVEESTPVASEATIDEEMVED